MKLAITLIALTLFTATYAGEMQEHHCPPGQTPTSEGDKTCIDCETAAHAQKKKKVATDPDSVGCDVCSRDHPKCELCSDKLMNPSKVDPVEGLCQDCDINGCLYCDRMFSKDFRGCINCDAANKFFKFWNADTSTMECTNCNSGADIANCVECGGKNAANCAVCHNKNGCHWCKGHWRFNKETMTTIEGTDGKESHFGECTSCRHGHKLTTEDDGSTNCNHCEEGFHLVDGKCTEVNDAMCGNHVIPGCQKCGENDPTKCAWCAPGFGPKGMVKEGEEFEACMICHTKGCTHCALHMKEGMHKPMQVCKKCAWNPETEDPEWCTKHKSAYGLSALTSVLFALFLFRF